MEKKIVSKTEKNIKNNDVEIKKTVKDLKEIIFENSKKKNEDKFKFDTNSIQKISFLLSNSEKIILENDNLKAESEMFKLVNKSFVEDGKDLNPKSLSELKDGVKEKIIKIENSVNEKKELKELRKNLSILSGRNKFLEETLKDSGEKNRRLNLSNKDLRLSKVKMNSEIQTLKEKILDEKSFFLKKYQDKNKMSLDKNSKLTEELTELNQSQVVLIKENQNLKDEISEKEKKIELQNNHFEIYKNDEVKKFNEKNKRFEVSEDDRKYLADQNSLLKNTNEEFKSEIEILKMKNFGIEKLNKDLEKDILNQKNLVTDLDKKNILANNIVLEQRENIKENLEKISFIESSLQNEKKESLNNKGAINKLNKSLEEKMAIDVILKEKIKIIEKNDIENLELRKDLNKALSVQVLFEEQKKVILKKDSEILDLNKKLEDGFKKISSVEEHLEKQKNIVLSRDENISDLEQKLNDTSEVELILKEKNEILELKNKEISELEQKINESSSFKNLLDEEKNIVLQKDEKITVLKKELKESLSSLSSVENLLEEQIKTVLKKDEVNAGLESKISVSFDKLTSLEEENEELKSDSLTLKNDIQSYSKTIKDLNTDIEDYKVQIEASVNESSESIKSLEKSLQDKSDEIADFHELRKRLEDDSKKHEELNESISKREVQVLERENKSKFYLKWIEEQKKLFRKKVVEFSHELKISYKLSPLNDYIVILDTEIQRTKKFMEYAGIGKKYSMYEKQLKNLSKQKENILAIIDKSKVEFTHKYRDFQNMLNDSDLLPTPPTPPNSDDV